MRRLLFAALFLLLLVACEERYVEPNYFQGTQGLLLEFAQGTPTEVYEGSVHPLRMELWNRGATRVNYSFVRYRLSGDSFYVQIRPDGAELGEDALGFLYGKELGYPEGDWLDFTHELQAKAITGLRERPETQLAASICYPYETFLGDTVCVDANSFNGNVQRQVCDASILTYQDQGAPIAVTRIENIPSPTMGTTGQGERLSIVQPTFVVHIKNVGDGRVVMPIEGESRDVYRGTLANTIYDIYANPRAGTEATENVELEESIAEACQTGVTELSNAVAIEARLSNFTLECEPANIRLVNGEGFTTCHLPFDDNTPLYTPNYLATLTVRLSYVYRATYTHDLEIIRRPEGVEPADFTTRELDENPGYIDRLTRCEFCSRSPNDPRCSDWNREVASPCLWNVLDRRCDAFSENTNIEVKVNKEEVVRSFRCACGEVQCRSDDYDCMRGLTWCPGTNTCCAESIKAMETRLRSESKKASS